MLLHHARSLLFLPASNLRAIEKSRGLACDMVMLDLEDAVADDRKEDARSNALAAVTQGGFDHRLISLRINTFDTQWHQDDVATAVKARVDYVILPKVETPHQVDAVFQATGKRVIAMIETALGVFSAQAIAAAPGTSALFVGSNDLRRDLGVPGDASRKSLATAMQMIVMAARSSGRAVFDGVYNRLEDAAGFEQDCREGQQLGFDGKTLIHPNQVDIANHVFGPTAEALAEAQRLLDAATGGAERFEGTMIETMHVDSAKALIARGREYACGEDSGAAPELGI